MIKRTPSKLWGSALLVPALIVLSAAAVPAQDTGAPAPAAVPPGQAAAPTPDAVTNSRIELLTDEGLIGRQSLLGEGLLLMERQLRQAQLVGQLLSVLGPDAEIEVAPGVFQSFADTPAGMRERIAFLELQAELAEKEAEVAERIESPSGLDEDPLTLATLDGAEPEPVDPEATEPGGLAAFLSGLQSAGLSQLSAEGAEPTSTEDGGEVAEAGPTGLDTLVIQEIYGPVGDLVAIIEFEGRQVAVKSNQVLPTGDVIVAVRRDALEVAQSDGVRREFVIR